jgi:hypothetical protein
MNSDFDVEISVEPSDDVDGGVVLTITEKGCSITVELDDFQTYDFIQDLERAAERNGYGSKMRLLRNKIDYKKVSYGPMVSKAV